MRRSGYQRSEGKQIGLWGIAMPRKRRITSRPLNIDNTTNGSRAGYEDMKIKMLALGSEARR
jgi:hypothetical protein